MLRRSRLFRTGLLLTALLGLGIVGGWSVRAGAPASQAPTPPTVALVDLERLINGLDELKARNDVNEKKNKERSDTLKGMSDRLENMEKRLKELPKDAKDDRIAITAEYIELKAQGTAKKQVFEQMIAIESGEIIRDLYLKVQTECQAYATKNGFDIVLMDDRGIDLPAGGTNRDYNDVIRSKRILYAKPSLDVTADLITIMNNSWSASGGKIVPTAPVAPTTAPKTDTKKKN